MANNAEGQEIQRDYIIQKDKIISSSQCIVSLPSNKVFFVPCGYIPQRAPWIPEKKWFRFVISGYILGTETVSCRLLQGMDMDWNLKKLGQLFQVKYYVFKYHQKNSDCLVLSDEICSISSEHSNDFGTETT